MRVSIKTASTFFLWLLLSMSPTHTVLALPTGAPPSSPGIAPGLTNEQIDRVLNAALAAAKEQGVNITAAVTDAEGNRLAFRSSPGASPGSVLSASAKARTSALFRRPTKAFEDGVRTNPGLVTLPEVVAVEGGLPLVRDGQIVGAVGVGGGTSAQDGQFAQAGASTLE